jgi:hypothetical protein
MYLNDYADANYALELQKPYWSVDDGVPILLGVSPFFAQKDALEAHEFDDSFACEAMRLRGLVLMAHETADLSPRFRPIHLINWALQQHIAVPKELLALAASRGLGLIEPHNPIEAIKIAHRAELAIARAEASELRELVNKLGGELSRSSVEIEELQARCLTAPDDSSDADPASQEHSLITIDPKKSNTVTISREHTRSSADTRKYNSSTLIAYGLAKLHYCWTGSGLSGTKIKTIEDDLRRVGISIDDETLRKHLLTGSEQASRK